VNTPITTVQAGTLTISPQLLLRTCH